MDSTEVERLRDENAQLRAALDRKHSRWRSIMSAACIMLGIVLAPVAVVSVWANNLVTDSDRYVDTVAPLARDPAIQDAIADNITTEIFRHVDIQGLTAEVIAALETRDLPPRVAQGLQALQVPITNGVRGFVASTVDRVVTSQQFTDAWVAANRVAHDELVAAMTGQGGSGSVAIRNGQVSLNLAPLIDQVKAILVNEGFTVADRIPAVNASFVIFQSDDITTAQGALRILQALGTWLPIIVLILLGVGSYVARDHRRALMAGAIGVVAAMVVLRLTLTIVRSLYLNAVPSELVPREAATVIYDTLVRFLRDGVRLVLLVAVIVALAAFLGGPSVTAMRIRKTAAQVIASLRGSTGVQTGQFGHTLYIHRQAIRIALVAIAAVIFIFLDQPTGVTVLVLVGGLILSMALLEFLGQQPKREIPSTEH